jgi:hypothetical protein
MVNHGMLAARYCDYAGYGSESEMHNGLDALHAGNKVRNGGGLQSLDRGAVKVKIMFLMCLIN